MLENFTWYKQSAFRFKGERLVMYIDPWGLDGDLPPADVPVMTGNGLPPARPASRRR